MSCRYAALHATPLDALIVQNWQKNVKIKIEPCVVGAALAFVAIPETTRSQQMWDLCLLKVAKAGLPPFRSLPGSAVGGKIQRHCLATYWSAPINSAGCNFECPAIISRQCLGWNQSQSQVKLPTAFFDRSLA